MPSPTSSPAPRTAARISRPCCFWVSTAAVWPWPLSLVARLEEFKLADVERTGEVEVVQYRNQIMPLMRLSKLLDFGEQVTDEVPTLQVVVYTENGRSVGLVVDNILDIVEEALAVQRKSEQDGLLGSAVVGGKVTDLLNVQGLVRAFDPTFFEDTASAVLEEVSHV